MKKIATSIIACAVSMALSNGATITFDGPANTTYNWSDVASWDPETVPGAGDDINIAAAVGARLVVDGGSRAANSMTHTNVIGASVISASGGGTLTVGTINSGSANVALTFRGSGTAPLTLNVSNLNMSGNGTLALGNQTSATQFLSALNATGITTLNDAGKLALNINTTSVTPAVFNTVNMNGGEIDLNKINAGTVYVEMSVLSAAGLDAKTVRNTNASYLTIVDTLSPGGAAGAGNSINFALSGSAKLELADGAKIQMSLGTVSDVVSFESAGDWLVGSGTFSLDLASGAGFAYDTPYTIFQNVTTAGFNPGSIYLNSSLLDPADYTWEQSGDNYVLTLVPEPSAIALGICASLFFGILRRKRCSR